MIDWNGIAIAVVGAFALLGGSGMTYVATSRGKKLDHQSPVTVAQAYAQLVEDLRRQNDDQSKRIERLEIGQKAMRVALEEAKAAELECLARSEATAAELRALKRDLGRG